MENRWRALSKGPRMKAELERAPICEAELEIAPSSQLTLAWFSSSLVKGAEAELGYPKGAGGAVN